MPSSGKLRLWPVRLCRIVFATTNARGGTKWSVHIDPHTHRERDWTKIDLLSTGTTKSNADVERPSARKKTTNAPVTRS
jgi:hypothetical protein